MKDFAFYNPVRVVMGEAALEKLAEVSAGRTVLLVCGGASARLNGSLERVAVTVRGGGGTVVQYGGVTQCTYGTVYRENLALVFPRWLVFAARHHPEPVCRFAVEVLGVSSGGGTEATVRAAYERTMGVLRRGGLPTTLQAYGIVPTDEEVAAATERVSSKEFTVEEYCALVRACTTEAFPGLE